MKNKFLLATIAALVEKVLNHIFENKKKNRLTEEIEDLKKRIEVLERRCLNENDIS